MVLLFPWMNWICTADPLFVDPYVECLLPPGIQLDVNGSLHHHCLATRFIDDKLRDSMKNDDGLRQVEDYTCITAALNTSIILAELRSYGWSLSLILQVVLLTDGMDTRPYRINWPLSTVVFDVSPESIFRSSTQKLEGLYCYFLSFT